MVNIHVCVGSACHLKGSYNVINALQREIEKRELHDEIEIKAVFCLGHCTEAVSVRIDEEEKVYSLNAKNILEFFDYTVMQRVEKK